MAHSREARHAQVHERPDREGEDDGADADRAAEQPADREHGELDDRAAHPDRPPEPRVHSCHQAVSRPGPESRADVDARRERDQQRSTDEQRELHHDALDRRHDRERGLHDGAEQEDVRDRAHAGPLPQRDPEQQHEQTHDVRDPADTDARVQGEALREGCPRIDSQTGADRESISRAVEGQSDDEGEDAAGHSSISAHRWTLCTSPI
ncbi:MAG: hypothetical protein J0I33_01270 [Microbacterium ginsengisoli]|uniref:hypothetical protein n=1 Tax=Microbacterium sp. 71-23 TaxID=1895787 RepID=UPI0013A5D2E8|nr:MULTISPECIES: hypothetical protein [unclassified Microbacterium]MBN9197261.1 hypothetical protein [Microbacterium ginsengisoli]